MNTLTHEERYAAVKSGSTYLLPETVRRDWDASAVTYSSYEELLEKLKPVCESGSHKKVLHFLAAKNLMEQVFETLINEYGTELGELGGITVVSHGIVLFSAQNTNPEWPRILVLHLERIALTAKQFHKMEASSVWLYGLGAGVICLLTAFVAFKYRKII